MFIVGLTGGIASGKTAVSDRFARLGVPVIDTDLIARTVVEPGQPALDAVISAFGGDIVDSTGQLRRRKLREIIFSDPGKQELLESILHPAIRKETRRQVAELASEYCIVVIPLLAESGHFEWLDRILVVDVPEKFQLERLRMRDDVTGEQAKASLAAQASRQQRLDIADDVIENTGTLQDLDASVGRLHSKYLGLAADKRR